MVCEGKDREFKDAKGTYIATFVNLTWLVGINIDILAIEQTKEYHGLYFVLLGSIFVFLHIVYY